MSTFRKALIAGVMIFAPSIGLVAVAEAQRSIRIGASASKTGTYAAQGGASELARKRGLQVVFAEAYPKGNTDFSAILSRARATTPDAVGAAAFFEDVVTITRQMKQLNLNPKMYAVTVGAELPKFYEVLGQTAEFVYGPSEWEPEFVTLRAGGLIPIARQYPGAREFVEAHHRAYPGADLSYQTAINLTTGAVRCSWKPSSAPAPWTGRRSGPPF